MSSKNQKTTSLRGMYDVLPNDIWMWQRLEKTVSEVFNGYFFKEIRFPIVEETALFHTAIGEATDVVEKEMFSFENRSGTSISLRPEGTAGCVRAVIQNNLCNRGLVQKLWYKGQMFRYERPQKGRNRQFTQVGAEIFNVSHVQADVELILMSARLWKQLGLTNIRLEINSLGSKQTRLEYREVLIKYFTEHIGILDEDAIKRLHSNPLRILDSKNPKMVDIINNAPKMSEFLDPESRSDFDQLTQILDECKIKYQINPKLVRGLDYYSKTVFEWITDDLGSQGTICGGGRYDSLVELQGGNPTPAVGFAMGLDRIIELIKDLNIWTKDEKIDAYLIVDKEISPCKINSLSERIRNELPNIKMVTSPNPTSIKAQFKKADKISAQFAIIIGENEIKSGMVTLKSLIDKSYQQKTIDFNEFVQFMRSL